MIFLKTKIPGVYEIQPELLSDERGSFARLSCNEEFIKNGLLAEFSQCSMSWNPRRHTLRGMHFQANPYGEHKLVRCTRGRIWDVALDLRPDSPTRYQWHGQELSESNRIGLYIPPGVAHGFLTLEADCEVLYLMHEPYQPGYGRGVRWNDPCFNLAWPAEPECISDRDANWRFINLAKGIDL